MNEKYVITGRIKGSDTCLYLRIGDYVLGWTRYLTHAKFFDNVYDCKEMIASNEFQREVVLCDGTRCPSHVLHDLSEVSNDKLSEDVVVDIKKVVLEDVESYEIHCEIKKQNILKGFLDGKKDILDKLV